MRTHDELVEAFTALGKELDELDMDKDRDRAAEIIDEMEDIVEENHRLRELKLDSRDIEWQVWY